MHRFIDGEDWMHRMLLPNSLEDYVSANPTKAPIMVIKAT
jgi:hypothetical protein